MSELDLLVATTEEFSALISGKSKACVGSIAFVSGKSKACVGSIAYVSGKSKVCMLRYTDVKAVVGYDTVSIVGCKQYKGHA